MRPENDEARWRRASTQSEQQRSGESSATPSSAQARPFLVVIALGEHTKPWASYPTRDLAQGMVDRLRLHGFDAHLEVAK